MKNFILISIFSVALIILLLDSNLFSGNSNDLIKNFNESLSLEKQKKYSLALDVISSNYESNKDNYLLNLRLGWLNYLLGKYDQSIVFYKKASEISNNQSIEALLGITYPLSAKNEWDKIKNTYEKILDIDRNNFTANLRLGQLLLNQKKYSDAKLLLEKAHFLYPSEYEPMVSLSWLYYYIGKNSDAKRLFKSTLMISPNDSLAKLGLNLVN